MQQRLFRTISEEMPLMDARPGPNWRGGLRAEGSAMLVEGGAKLTSAALTDVPLEYFAVYPVERGARPQLDNIGALNAAVRSVVTDAAESATLAAGDTRTWAPELGNPHAFCGLYRTGDGRPGSTHYWIAVRASLPAVCVELLDKSFQGSGSLAVQEFARGAEMTAARDLTRRNAQRLAHNAARALGVRLAHSSWPDVAAHVKSPHVAPPRLAVGPHHEQWISNVAPAPRQRGAYGIYSETTAAPVNSTVALIGGPYDGFRLYRVQPSEWTHPLPCTTGYTSQEGDDTLGKSATTSSLGKSARGGSSGEHASRCTGFICAPGDARLAPGAYHALDKVAQSSGLERAATDQAQFTPVLVKLYCGREEIADAKKTLPE